MSDDGLRQLLRMHIGPPLCDWLSVETGGTEGGVPDCNFCVSREGLTRARAYDWRWDAGSIEGWIECKATRALSVSVRPAQVGWIERRMRHGGRVLIAVRRRCAAGRRREARDELWMLRGDCVRALRDGGLAAVGVNGESWILGRWSGGPSRWDWDEVLRAMVR